MSKKKTPKKKDTQKVLKFKRPDYSLKRPRARSFKREKSSVPIPIIVEKNIKAS